MQRVSSWVTHGDKFARHMYRTLAHVIVTLFVKDAETASYRLQHLNKRKLESGHVLDQKHWTGDRESEHSHHRYKVHHGGPDLTQVAGQAIHKERRHHGTSADDEDNGEGDH